MNYRRQPCSFCAFRPGSPERADKTGWQNLLLSCCHRVFFCHKTMFRTGGTEESGQYDPARRADGTQANPADHQVCAGFAKMFGEEFGIDTAIIASAEARHV